MSTIKTLIAIFGFTSTIIQGTYSKPWEPNKKFNVEHRPTAQHARNPGFEENKGQVRTNSGETAPYVRFHMRLGDRNIFLLNDGIAYQIDHWHLPLGLAELEAEAIGDHRKQHELDALRQEIQVERFRMDMLLEGADPNTCVTLEGRSTAYTHYYNHGALDVHTYTKVTYHAVYPGIDWVVYLPSDTSGVSGLKYDFVLQPGADPDQIQLRFIDHEELRLDQEGDLIHGNRMGTFIEQRPLSFQNGREVPTRFVLNGDVLRFALSDYDRTQALTIDPMRIWGTYFGGPITDVGTSCVVDQDANVYLVGMTSSTVSIGSGGHQMNYAGGSFDALLAKFDSEGSRLWATYYGGSDFDHGYSCAVDNEGNIYMAGNTGSTDGIASDAYQENYGGGPSDAFLVKFHTDGNRLWGTYVGGSGDDRGVSCAVHSSGSIYLTGGTDSGTDIASDGHQNLFGGEVDAFLVKFDTDGNKVWGTYYGGSDHDYGQGCAVDAEGNIHLTGDTRSTDAIASSGHQDLFGGIEDAFLVKFGADGTRIWGTYLGGNSNDGGRHCAIDGNGNVYMVGTTRSNDNIAFNGHQNTFGGGADDGFLVKFDLNGDRIWGTYFGGSDQDRAISCTTDAIGNIYISGDTHSMNAIASNGFQNTHGGNNDAFLAKFAADGSRIWSTYYGGSDLDQGWSCTLDMSGAVYLAGRSRSTNGIAANAHQVTNGGGPFDAFLAKFEASGTVGMDRDPALSATELSIWPNPSNSSQVWISIESLPPHITLLTVNIHDISGQLVQRSSVPIQNDKVHTVLQLDSVLAAGSYMLVISAGRYSWTERLVLQR